MVHGDGRPEWAGHQQAGQDAKHDAEHVCGRGRTWSRTRRALPTRLVGQQ